MRMLELMGALLIICSAGFAGLQVAAIFTLRSRQLRALQEVLQLLDTEIMYGATPLPAALRKVAAAGGEVIGAIFLTTGELLSTEHGYTAAEAWSLALDRSAPRAALNQEDRAILRSFGAALGSSDRAEQHKHIAFAALRLRQEEEKAELARQKNERIWRYGGFLAGISVVLLLL